ncbi:GntR family transcriptional regulator [Microbacterium sp. S16(2024)]|uniref:GntR family transcriptional regulator n=1 Tax=Microbacterium sp. S16(2024) TaxID=3368601 RepID=UPI00373E8A97
MAHTIERVSPVPYYEQLFEILRDRIAQGDIAEEERLPSELELCREFGLSRATVRQTLTKLENEGYAHRIPRRGVFASVPGQTAGWTVQEGFLESQLRHGRTGITTEVVGQGYVTPDSHVADALRVGTDDVFALERIRSLDGTKAMFSTNWFPREVGRTIEAEAGVLDGSASLNSHLRAAGFVSSGAQRIIHALPAPPEVAAHLGVGVDHPVLRVRSLSWAADGTRFDYYETWVLTDVIPLEVSVAAS